ncbi:hypothetical protein PVK06_049153 [Gossypium arboreum]|uniref:Secreted protein n=1 Tax=Gossypium arboreum TaxID=29729 RepID=A0ABR0MHY2_GOSAR|nr:hypothetical protein PVK06_049153 [Gossypium arboreum]
MVVGWLPVFALVSFAVFVVEFAEHVSTELAVLSALGTGVLSELHTYWTRVCVAYGACGTSCEFIACIRSETATFPRSS